MITTEWWGNRRHEFELFISPVVVDEAKLGDPQAAAKRLAVLEGLNTLTVTNEVIQFAARLINEKAIPETELRDAYHVSCACIHGMNYLLTWNCKHLANAQRREEIQQLAVAQGYLSPVLCTPEELLGD